MKYIFPFLLIFTLVKCQSETEYYAAYNKCAASMRNLYNQCYFNYSIDRNEKCQKFTNNCSKYTTGEIENCEMFKTSAKITTDPQIGYNSIHCTKSTIDNSFCIEKYNNTSIDTICKEQDSCKESIIFYTNASLLLMGYQNADNKMKLKNEQMFRLINRIVNSNECKNGALNEKDIFILNYDDLDIMDDNYTSTDKEDNNKNNDSPNWKTILIYAGIIVGALVIFITVITLSCICFMKEKRKIKNKDRKKEEKNQIPVVNTTIPNTVPQIIMVQSATPVNEINTSAAILPTYDQAISEVNTETTAPQATSAEEIPLVNVNQTESNTEDDVSIRITSPEETHNINNTQNIYNKENLNVVNAYPTNVRMTKENINRLNTSITKVENLPVADAYPVNNN